MKTISWIACSLILLLTTAAHTTTVTFSSPMEITTSASLAQSVFAIDLDGDGDPDILSASYDDNKIAWYENRLNQAEQDFGSQQVITTSTIGARSVCAADLDGDADADVISLSENDFSIAWYENRLNQTTHDFGPQQVITISTKYALLIYVLDLDSDGDDDVLSLFSNQIAWFENRLNQAEMDFGPLQTIYSSSGGNLSVSAKDFDDDGDADIFYSEMSSTYIDFNAYSWHITIGWLENKTNQTEHNFEWREIIESFYHSDLSDVFLTLLPMDVDEDGDWDILSFEALYFSSINISNTIALYENRLNQVEQHFNSHKSITTSTIALHGIKAADIDSDGDEDVLCQSPNQRVWYENRLNQTEQDFGPPQNIIADNYTRSIYPVDIEPI
ncbi:VCBS repeat-containing protein [Candidatus Sumerlaeota bacterium]|nr:VCBS repeat-containing protein [Candidatus Sumerlaeota bacterium]